MLRIKAVKDPLQMGFHLLATGNPGSGKPSQSTYFMVFLVDRNRSTLTGFSASRSYLTRQLKPHLQWIAHCCDCQHVIT